MCAHGKHLIYTECISTFPNLDKIHNNYHIAGKFGGELNLAVWRSTLTTAKLKSAKIFAMAIWDPTAKFNSRQYFRLYSIIIIVCF